MNFHEVNVPLKWCTLKNIFEDYCSRTPSEEGVTAAELIERAAKVTKFRQVAIKVTSKSLTPEHHARELALIGEINEQATRMRSIVAHIMTRDAAQGVWFATGIPDTATEHSLIQQSYWQFALLNIDEGVIRRENSFCFRDLRCAYAKDIPENHPIRKHLRGEPVAVDWKPVSARLPNSAGLIRTGAPGRPSNYDVVEEEFERRVKVGLIEPSLKRQSEVLAAWLRTSHPDLRPCKPKTIRNRLQDCYWAARQARPKT